MKHLTLEEIELFAEADWLLGEDSATRGDAALRRHLAECTDCREEVEAVRALALCLSDLPEIAPEDSIADAVLSRIDLPAPWLDEALAGLPRVAPSSAFSASVMDAVDLPLPWLDEALARLPHVEPSGAFAASIMERVDLPLPWLEKALTRVPQVAPAPGFATGVMARVRLPIPWRQRAWRFARRRKVALAGAAAATMTVSGLGAAWLFGIQGVTPAQFVTFLVSGVRDLAVRGLVALGGIGYELGLIDAGSTITAISPTAVLGSLALAGAIGLLSLFVMARLMRAGPELRLGKSA